MKTADSWPIVLNTFLYASRWAFATTQQITAIGLGDWMIYGRPCYNSREAICAVYIPMTARTIEKLVCFYCSTCSISSSFVLQYLATFLFQPACSPYSTADLRIMLLSIHSSHILACLQWKLKTSRTQTGLSVSFPARLQAPQLSSVFCIKVDPNEWVFYSILHYPAGTQQLGLTLTLDYHGQNHRRLSSFSFHQIPHYFWRTRLVQRQHAERHPKYVR